MQIFGVNLLDTAAVLGELLMIDAQSANIFEATRFLQLLSDWSVPNKYYQAGRICVGAETRSLSPDVVAIADKAKVLLAPLDGSLHKKAARVDRLRLFYSSAYSDLDLVLVCVALHASRMIALSNTVIQDTARRMIAEENEDIFVPLCDFLGMWRLRSILGDISLQLLRPTERSLIIGIQNSWLPVQDTLFHRLRSTLLQAVRADLPGLEMDIKLHTSHTFNIYQKMALKGESLSEISAIVSRLRMDVLIQQERNCFEVRAFLHKVMSQPEQGFTEGTGFSRERIEKPKFNGHRSLITTCIRPLDQMHREGTSFREAAADQVHEVEFHILTPSMLRINMEGVGADRSSKTGTEQGSFAWWTDMGRRQSFLKRLECRDGDEMVFSPAGEIYALKQGATPIDFAYRVHSGIGNHCKRLWVNGCPARYDQVLKSGDLVEIEADPAYVGPLEKWAGVVATNTAKREIGRALSKPRFRAGEKVFKEALDEELERRGMWGLSVSLVQRRLEEKAVKYGFVDLGAMYVDLGTQTILPAWRKALLDDIVMSLVDTAMAEYVVPANPATCQIPSSQYEFVRCSHAGESCQVVVGKTITGHRVKTAAGEQLFIYAEGCSDLPQNQNRVILEWRFQSQIIGMSVTASARPLLVQQLSTEVHKLATQGLALLDLHSESHGPRGSTIKLTLKTSTSPPLQKLVIVLAQMEADGIIESFCLDEYETPSAGLPQPYAPADGINDMSLFMGRKAEVRTLREAATSPKLSQRLFKIVGNNRIGKSSLLEFLQEYFKSRKELKVIPILVNLQEANEQSEGWLWRELVKKTVQAISEFAPLASVTPPLLLEGGSLTYDLTKIWLNQAQASIKNYRLFIMIDELHLIDCDWGREEAKVTFRNLRDLVKSQGNSETYRPAMFVVSVLDAYYARQGSYWKEEKFGFGLLCAGFSILLCHLETEDAFKLIETPLRGMLDFDIHVKERIFFDTAGHPYYLQHLLYRIVNQASRGSHFVTMEDYLAVRGKLCSEEQSLFHHFLRDVGETGRDLLAASAHALKDQWATPHSIRRNWRPYDAAPTLAEIKEQLPLLIKRGVLKGSSTQPTKYGFEIPLLAEWLRYNPAQIVPKGLREKDNG